MSERGRFLVVVFTWRGAAKVSELEPIFNKALDWIKLGANSWVLWTSRNAGEWQSTLQPLLGTDDTLFVAELTLQTIGENYSGWQYKWVWEWFDKHR